MSQDEEFDVFPWEQDRPALLEWFDELEMPGYPASVAVTWQRSFEQLTPTARALLRLLGHLAADPIPVEMLTEGETILAEAVELLGQEIGQKAETTAVRAALAELVKYSLVTTREEEAIVHRVVQQVVLGRIPEDRRMSVFL